MNYHFKIREKGYYKRDTLIFCNRKCIFELNFETGKTKNIYTFENKLNRQPLKFIPNKNYTVFLISSPNDGLLLNLEDKNEFELNKYHNIKNIKNVIFDSEDKSYYVICNMCNDKLGFFLLKISMDNPEKSTYLIKWKNKLDIADVCM